MKKSLYDIPNNRMNRLKNIGYAYEGKIFEKTMSPLIFADPVRRDILASFETMIFFLVEKVKYIKTFYNYTVSKNYRNLN
jgi:hypothetical protein